MAENYEEQDPSDADVLEMVREFKDGHSGCSREAIVGHLVGEGVSEMKSNLAADFAAKGLVTV